MTLPTSDMSPEALKSMDRICTIVFDSDAYDRKAFDALQALQDLLHPISDVLEFYLPSKSLETLIANAILQVPKEHRQVPCRRLFGCVMDTAKFYVEEGPHFDLFTNLLAKSFDSEKHSESHVAYGALLRDLHEDEIKFLDATHDGLLKVNTSMQINVHPLSEVVACDIEEGFPYIKKGELETSEKSIFIDFPLDIRYPENVFFYIDRLTHVGLILADSQDELSEERMKSLFKRGEPKCKDSFVGLRSSCTCILSGFGAGFYKTCFS